MSDPASSAVDIDQLAGLLRKRRAEDGKSLRQVSAETGVPFTTLSRVESGKLPDLTTFRNIVNWLGIPPERFFPTPKVKQETTPDVIARVIHSDPALTEPAREQLAAVVSQMYASLTIQTLPVMMHTRAAPTFKPQAGKLLADLLQQMQDKLIDESRH